MSPSSRNNSPPGQIKAGDYLPEVMALLQARPRTMATSKDIYWIAQENPHLAPNLMRLRRDQCLRRISYCMRDLGFALAPCGAWNKTWRIPDQVWEVTHV